MKTIICDIDGTIFKYQGGTPEVTNNRVEPLPGVIKQMNQWDAGFDMKRRKGRSMK